MPKITKSPRVTVVTEKNSKYFGLSFEDPRANWKRKKKSSETSDRAIADDLAVKLSVIIHHPDMWAKLPNGTPESIKRIWFGDDFDQLLQRDAASKILSLVAPDQDPDEFASPENMVRWMQKFETPGKIASALVGTFRHLQEENQRLNQKWLDAKELLKKCGVNENEKPQLLSVALEQYLETWKEKRKGSNVASDCNRLLAALPQGIMAGDVSAPMVIKFLGDLENPGNLSYDYLWDIYKRVSRFLDVATFERWARAEVKAWCVSKWMDATLAEQANREDPLWLDAPVVESIIVHMPEYWGRVAMIQWGGGFRPEELAFLQTGKIGHTDRGQDAIRVAPLVVEGTEYWAVKNPKNGYGWVGMPDWSLPTLKSLKDQKSFLLFPNDPALHGGVTPRYSPTETKERELQLWTGGAFTTQYLAELRAAAKKAGHEKLVEDKSKRFDSRTLRRSAAKRIVLETNIHDAAAILRDDHKTIQTHYGKLKGTDTINPSGKGKRENGA